MKVITVRQPWAWAIFHGKDVENRSQNWSYRGPLAIHAGQSWSRTGQRSPLVRAAAEREYGPLRANWPPETKIRGFVLGIVDLVDVHRAEPDAGCCDSPWAEAHYRDQVSGAEIGSVTHLVHESPRLFDEPIAAAGRLGLWTPDPDLLAMLEVA